MREINLLVVHCSASDNPDQDSPEAIKELHTAPKSKKFNWGKYKTNGFAWSDNGYNFVIAQDGKIHICRPLERPGAHAKGYNLHSIGICLTGEYGFTEAQFKSLEWLCQDLCEQFGISKIDIVPHKSLEPNKTCPNFDLIALISSWPWT